MTTLWCEVSCTIRRSTQPSVILYRDTITSLMTAACRRSGAWIRQQNQRNTCTSRRPFDDILIVIDIQVQINRRTQDEAADVISEAFSKELINLDRTNASYYLYVKPDNKPENIFTYFHDMSLKSFALGFMSKADQFHTQFDYQQSIYSHSRQNPRLTLEIDRGELKIDFAVSSNSGRFHKVNHGISPTTEVYRLSINFKDLGPNVLIHKSNNNVTLCFLTYTPVQLWRTQFDLPNLGKIDEDKTKWMRTCNVTSVSEVAKAAFLNRETIGNCHVLLLRFDANLMHPYRLPEPVQDILHSLQHIACFVPYYTVLNYNRRTTFRPPPFIEGYGVSGVNWLLAAIHSIGYRVQYQLEQISSIRGNQFITSVRRNVNSQDAIKHLNNALNKTYDVLLQDMEYFLNISTVLDHFLAERAELGEMVIRTPSRMIKRFVVTPSRIIFLAPSLMHDNRILRTFEPEFAVSCSFKNDDMQELPAVADNIQFIRESIGEVLRNGVTVAKRHYEFLACSGSQLRNNGCWFYACDPYGRTAGDIRNWMGNLEHIRNPGAYLSRMGQCFSDTTAAELDADIEIEWEDTDVEGGMDPNGKPYCFSDGVGRISEECLKQVFIRGTSNQLLPSAFQVRLGGSKGMLTLDKNLAGKQIMIRKSMYKFRSDHRTVEIMKTSKPCPLFLNKQIITILSQLKNGIADYVFIRFMNSMLHRLADVLLDDDKALQYLSEGGFPCPYAKLHKAGFRFTADPFFRNVLKAIICARINSLKLKTRIEIPHEHGRNMLGVMDEEGVLEYGEVFIQYSSDIREPKKHLIVLTGHVVVSKMPALHPGDVRKLQAVDKPELRHLFDCIVFPQKGPRPHPNEMAGSDLDGDEYFVTWHPDLIFSGDNEPPMHFPSVKKEQQPDPISLNNMVDFIVTSIVNNQVGRISNAHMAWADQSTIYSEKCLELCAIFSHVIDFNKTGYLPEQAKGNKVFQLIPNRYPDFMGKQGFKDTYASDKILGKLYRIGQRVQQAIMTIDKEDDEKVNIGENWTVDKRFYVKGHEDFLQEAESLYELYEGYLDAEQRRYGIANEEELVSSCVTRTKGFYSRSDEHYDVENRLKDRMHDVRTYIHEKFDQMLEQKPGYEEPTDSKMRMQFAAACYVTTYENKRKHRSFPWLFADQFVRILQRTVQGGPPTPMQKLTSSINDIDTTDAARTFKRYQLDKPPDETLTKLYHILINWGQKSKFVLQEGSAKYGNILTVPEFVLIIDKVIDEHEDMLDDEPGPLLCGMMKWLTSLSDQVTVQNQLIPKEAIISMKRQILLAHHQLARDPRATCLLIRKQAQIERNISIPKDRWIPMRDRMTKIADALKQKFKVNVELRETSRQKGHMWVSGLDNDVFDFNEFWFDEFKVTDYITDSETDDSDLDH